MNLKRHLFKPMQEAKTLLREAFMSYSADGHEPTDEELKPTNAERKEFERNSQNTLTLCKLLLFLSHEQSKAYLNSNSPTSLEVALVAEINSFEQRCRHQLPLDLRNVKYDKDESFDIQSGVAKCLFADLVALESTMQQIYDKTKYEEKKKAKKDRKKGRKASQPEASVEPENQGEANDGLDEEDVVTEQASVEPENQGEANDDLDKEDVVTEQASVESENQGEANDGLDKEDVVTEQASVESDNQGEANDGLNKEDVVTEQTCIPRTPFTQYSPGESTKYQSCIFKGKLTIPVPPNTYDSEKEPIPVMYFKMKNAVYEMSGFWWAKFSLEHPSEYILSVYEVGETVDEDYFIACETLEQPLEIWLKDPKHFNHEDRLPNTLKSFFKDVINGAAYVHNRSEGLLNAELSINNVYIVNGQAKLDLLRPMKPTCQKDVTASFRSMVVNQVFENIPIPEEVNHLLNYMQNISKSSWHPTCVTHPMFLSASQRCIYAKLASERVQASPRPWDIKKEIDQVVQKECNEEKLGIGSVKWIGNVKHATLLAVLKFKRNKLQESGVGMEEEVKEEDEDEEGAEELVEKEVRVEEKMEVAAKVEEVDYRDTPSSFLEFYRNLVVHMKKGALTYEEIISEMDKIIPNFLMCLQEALFYHHIYITVGQDLTEEEEEGTRLML